MYFSHNDPLAIDPETVLRVLVYGLREEVLRTGLKKGVVGLSLIHI